MEHHNITALVRKIFLYSRDTQIPRRCTSQRHTAEYAPSSHKTPEPACPPCYDPLSAYLRVHSTPLQPATARSEARTRIPRTHSIPGRATGKAIAWAMGGSCRAIIHIIHTCLCTKGRASIAAPCTADGVPAVCLRCSAGSSADVRAWD